MEPLRQSLSLSGSASYETKFLVPVARGPAILKWARATLTEDAHADLITGFYEVTTLYLDTADRAVLERRGPHAYRKYRMRRYGDESVLHLERKLKRRGRVRKIRWQAEEAEWRSSYWFGRRVAVNKLEPSAVIAYERAAFFGAGFRLTLDRRLRIAEAEGWAVRMPRASVELADGKWVLEVKHGGALPAQVRDLVLEHRLIEGGFSKYRDGMQRLSLVTR